LDINGGEPSSSTNYLQLLDQLPPNVRYLRLNTNGSRVIKVLPDLVKKGIEVTVTVSLDGIGNIHDYVRWPIKWENVERTLVELIDLKASFFSADRNEKARRVQVLIDGIVASVGGLTEDQSLLSQLS
jgi:MoaA/NifB/PqqE/SkfB family radical SAM enzyme